jgi:hypothetical protein
MVNAEQASGKLAQCFPTARASFWKLVNTLISQPESKAIIAAVNERPATS